MIKAPDEKASYAIICERFPSPSVYFDDYDTALKWAKSNQPSYRPYYIVKRTEHFEICGDVDINGKSTTRQDRNFTPVSERLPAEDEWVIGFVDDIHNGSDAPDVAIVKLRKGISKAERDELRRQGSSRSLIFKECDEWGNNLAPYCWKTQGAMTYFGQEITKWAPRPQG